MAVAREITGADLIIGEAYFILTFADEARVIPVVDSMIYIGQDIDGEQNGSRYFQDVASFLEFGAYPHVSNPSGEESHADIIVTEAEPPPNIFSVRGLVTALAEAAERSADRRSDKGGM